MGKGDKKSKRGKIFKGSFGARRQRKIKKAVPARKSVEETIQTQDEIKLPAAKKKLRTSASR